MSAAERWRLAARRAGQHSLVVLPPLSVGWVVAIGWQKNALAWDFTHAYLPAARAVVHGHSPYVLEAIVTEMAFVYPPVAAYLVAPFLLLPLLAAQVAATILSVAAIAGALWLLRVRDWRCYTVALLWVPSYAVIHGANLTLLLVLGAAAVWRWRDRPVLSGTVAGLVVAAKLFAWPLLLFLLVTRRGLAAAVAAAACGAFLFLPWAAIGFQGLGEYPHLLQLLGDAERADAYTLGALLAPLLGWPVAQAVTVIVGALVLLTMLKRRADERTALVLALAAALVLSPIVWMDYFLFLLLVLGVVSPRFSPLWLVPIALWVGPQVGNGAPWQTAFVLALVGAMFAVAASMSWGEGRPRERARARGPALRQRLTAVYAARVHAAVPDRRSRSLVWRVAVAVLGVALSAVLLGVALRSVRLGDVWVALGGARPGYVVLAVGALGSMYCLQALRWWRLLNAQGSVRWRDVLRYVVGGIACNNVLPGRPGDFARVHWAARGSSISHSSSLATLVVDRAADVTVLGLGLLLSLAILGLGGWPLAVALSGLALVGLVLAAGAVTRRRFWASAPLGSGRLAGLSRGVAAAGETFSVCFRPRLAAWLASLSVLAWASWALAALAIARALDLQLSVPELVFLTAVVNLGVAIPSSPGFVGTYQWLCVAALGVAGIGSADALAYSVLLHAAWFVPTTVAGAGLLAARVSGAAARPFPGARQQRAEVAA